MQLASAGPLSAAAPRHSICVCVPCGKGNGSIRSNAPESCPHRGSGVKQESFHHVTSDVRITAYHQPAAAFASAVHASCRLDFLSHHAASYYYHGPACHVGFINGILLRSLHFACTSRRWNARSSSVTTDSDDLPTCFIAQRLWT